MCATKMDIHVYLAITELLDALDRLESERAASHEHVFTVVARHVSSEMSAHQLNVTDGGILGGPGTLDSAARGMLFARIAESVADEVFDRAQARIAELERELADRDATIENGGDAVIDLRKQVADRDRALEAAQAQIASLQAQHDADAARIAGLEAAADRRLMERKEAERRADELEASAREATRKLQEFRHEVTIERDARIDEVAAEREAERAKRERIEFAAREVLDLRDRYGVLTITGEWTRADAAINALRIALGGAS